MIALILLFQTVATKLKLNTVQPKRQNYPSSLLAGWSSVFLAVSIPEITRIIINAHAKRQFHNRQFSLTLPWLEFLPAMLWIIFRHDNRTHLHDFPPGRHVISYTQPLRDGTLAFQRHKLPVHCLSLWDQHIPQWNAYMIIMPVLLSIPIFRIESVRI